LTNVATRRALDIVRCTLLAAAALLLASCGGGGGGSSPPPPPPVNNPPDSNAGTNQTVFEGDTVTLDGSASSDPDGDTLSYEWTQESGPTVTINNATSPMPTFAAPDVVAGTPETVALRLTVRDANQQNADIVNVTVEENEPPTAAAGPDRNVVENATVSLNGSASSDPNSIGVLGYTWVQVGGPNVTLSGANTATPSFTSPDVPMGGMMTLNFELTVSDGTFDDVDTVTLTVIEGQPFVSISGTVSYEFVPPNAQCFGLNFAATEARPIRGATVQLINDATSGVIQSTTADATGNYTFTNIPATTLVRLRVRAELKRNGSPSWDFEIRDNVDTSGSPPPLIARPVYVVEGSNFDTGGVDIIGQDLLAETGWNGSSYGSNRAAAPFAILDAFYSAVQLVLSADPTANFAALDGFWSVNNTLTTSTNIDTGELTASFYISNPDGGAVNPSLFLLGDASVDTEEFDDHVVVHEWGHYFEDTFSRSDSTGGPHSLGETIDARLAWGEGWATALAAMALDEPQYCDTGPAGVASGFGIDTEGGNFGIQGWFNEISVATLVYDLWDTVDDGADSGSVGFAAIYNAMTNGQASTEAWTTLFSFAGELRPTLNGAGQGLLDSLLLQENTVAGGSLDIWGTNETNNANGGQDVLPVHIPVTADGSTVEICTSSEYETSNPPDRHGNNLSMYRYIRLSVPVTDTYNVTIATTTATPATADPNDRDQSDPDMYIYRDGVFIAFGISGDANLEQFTTPQLVAGDTYVADLQEFRFEDFEGAPVNYPERICFDVTFAATP